ncbi:DUF2306 domain-containing protein [Marinomonas mediterranea]|jgi:Predicted membrane protein|uniref:Transmembrane protein n=1 Tax=Marinomonas mediterranea (strain ATCC 700492 / JCM 21426 / NBRC 103028 / MMB-1) TaxID=717774 RepID=F2JTS6_MARM1|nr:DUF2306 domain-containing protein [Marinomonas mediterranea]ADZ92696.1 Protein of unknown function DUF2306, membrane [Marinomonas mediterranea MMB-1]WCN10631.1 DUF2306 domain-containing protein [Marinomonas mediterranea]WCN14688.1 DUF2306 domain-containing protein [Marinomonas mediterranea]WCN18727.1 DUF2306 domain-containing protein [Marinomonas mediterranea MMB-1]
MTYLQLAYLHLATVLPAFVIGTILLVNRKGTPRHKLMGKCYMLLMVITASITLVMPAHVGPRLLDHFGFIHLFSLLVFYHVPNAIVAIRKGNVARHKSSMLGLYIGGLIIAGSFAFMPGRLLHTWLFT